MKEEKRYLVDVGMGNLPFPMNVLSRAYPNGQPTVATISVSARIMGEFEARWIDKFIQIVHQHREGIGTKTLHLNVSEYLKQLGASFVHVDFDYPFFIEKTTPVSKEKCLLRYMCAYSAKSSAVAKVRITFRIEVPVITTYPASTPGPGGPFGQLSKVLIEVQSGQDIYPEDLVDIVDRHALSPIYSFLTEEDQAFVIEQVHSKRKTSVVMVDEIKDELSRRRDIDSFSVRCQNFGMLHSYSTVIGTEKSIWVPFTETDISSAELL